MATANELIKRVARAWVESNPNKPAEEALDLMAEKLGYYSYAALVDNGAEKVTVERLEDIALRVGLGSICLNWDHLDANWTIGYGAFGSYLRHQRSRRLQTKNATELADALGVSASTVYEWCRGKNTLKLKDAQKMCTMLGISGFRFSNDAK